jgi:Sap, sulfolipid-1-addressing protein
MWGSVLVLALLMGLHPLRLGLILLVISRPRPMQNLLAYWVGGLVVSVTYMLVPLMVLHFTPWFTSFAHDLATPATGASSTVRHIQIGIGVLVLSIAALMTVRFSARQRAHLPTPGGNTSPLAPISRLLSRAQDAPTEGRSAIRRLLGRAHNAWENGSLWVAVVIGAGSAPAAEEILIVLVIIVASGAAIGTQVSAVIAVVLGTLAVVEIMLASYLATPAKTQAIVQLLHDWARAHRRQLLVAMFAVAGVALVANGMGSV